MTTRKMKAARERAAPRRLSHDDALELLLTARRLGPAVVHQGNDPGENEGDCCGGLLWRAAYELEHTAMPPVGAFPCKTKLAEFLRTLGPTCKQASYSAKCIVDCNDAKQIAASWDYCAEAVGVTMSEVLEAEQASQVAASVKMPRLAHVQPTGRMQDGARSRSGARAEELELVEA